MAVESEEILSKISDLINSKVDELSTNLNNFRQEASNNNQILENAIGSIKSVIDEKLSKIDQISSEINSIQTSVQNVADNVSVTNNKIDNILSQQTQLQRTVDSVSQNIEKLSTVTSNQLTYLSNQSQNITEKVDKLSLQQEREARTAAVEGARGTVVVDPATGKTVSGVAAADATGAGEETKQSLIGSVLSGIKGILTSPLALGGAALGAAALGTAAALRKEPPGTPQAGSDAEFNLSPDTSGSRRTGSQREPGPTIDPGPTQKYDPNLKVPKSRQRRINNLDNNKEFTDAVKRISKKHNVTREDIYSIIQGESDYDPTLLSSQGGYGGLFQLGRGTMYGKQAWGRSYSSNEIRKLSPVQQVLMYEKLLDEHKKRGWTGGREGLGLIQAAPAAVSRNLDPNTDLGTIWKPYGKGQRYWRLNPGWRSSRTGPITVESIRKYYLDRNKVNPLQRQETETAPPPDARREPPQQAPQPDSSREQTQEKLTPVDTGPGQEKFGYRGRGSPKGVDPRLMELFKKTAEDFPLRVRFMSGKLGRSRGAHSRGRAGDITIYDDAGNALPNYQNSRTFRIYEMFAQKMRENAKALYPELSDNNWKNGELDWGGLFGGEGNNPNKMKYGSADTMDYRINYGDKTRAGSIEGGLNSRYKGSYDKGDIFGGSKAYSPEVLKEDLERLKGFMLNKEQIEDIRKYGFFGVARASGQLPPKKPQESTREASDSGVPGIIVNTPTDLDKVTDSRKLPIPNVPGTRVTTPTSDRMNLGAPGVVPPKKPVKDPYKQFEGSIVRTYDLNEKIVDLKPSQPKNDMEEFNELLKMIKAQQEKQAQQAQQAPSQSQKVLGNLTGPEFFDPRTLKKLKDQNTGRDDTGVNSAEPPAQKKPDLNKIYT